MRCFTPNGKTNCSWNGCFCGGAVLFDKQDHPGNALFPRLAALVFHLPHELPDEGLQTAHALGGDSSIAQYPVRLQHNAADYRLRRLSGALHQVMIFDIRQSILQKASTRGL